MSDEPWAGSSLPADVTDKLSELGQPLAEFAVSGSRFVFLLSVGLVLLPLGAFLFFGPLTAMFGGGGGFGAALSHALYLGFVLLVSSIFLLIRASRTRGRRLPVSPAGVVQVQRHAVNAFLWEEVDTLWVKRHVHGWTRHLMGKHVLIVHREGSPDVQFDDAL